MMLLWVLIIAFSQTGWSFILPTPPTPPPPPCPCGTLLNNVCYGWPCPKRYCVDALSHPGSCCAECPNGPNCLSRGVKIREGESHNFGYDICTCTRGGDPGWVECQKATCDVHDVVLQFGETRIIGNSSCTCQHGGTPDGAECVEATCDVQGTVLHFGETRIIGNSWCTCRYGGTPNGVECVPTECYVHGTVLQLGETRIIGYSRCTCTNGSKPGDFVCVDLPPPTPYCPANCTLGGVLQCIPVTCMPPTTCVDAILKPGECCPECHNGPNCGAPDGSLMAVGQSKTIDGKNCTCYIGHGDTDCI